MVVTLAGVVGNSWSYCHFFSRVLHVFSPLLHDFFQYYCELSDQDSDKIFTKGSRKSEDVQAGVGKQKFIDGTGKWKKLIGAICIYGVKYVDEVLFASQKCKFPGE